MGLDMYLMAKEYVSNYSWKEEDEFHNENSRYNNLIKHVDKKGIQYKHSNSAVIEFEAMYWRKANAIHKWFVDNVQQGTDDCDKYQVTVNELEKLLEICEEVLANPNKAPDLLPVHEGFFFGTYDYDEWYLDNLKETVERLPELIEIAKDSLSIEFSYLSSW